MLGNSARLHGVVGQSNRMPRSLITVLLDSRSILDSLGLKISIGLPSVTKLESAASTSCCIISKMIRPIRNQRGDAKIGGSLECSNLRAFACSAVNMSVDFWLGSVTLLRTGILWKQLYLLDGSVATLGSRPRDPKLAGLREFWFACVVGP